MPSISACHARLSDRPHVGRLLSRWTDMVSDALMAAAVRTVEFAESFARLSPENPELAPELAPQDYATVNGCVDAMAGLDPEQREAAVKRAIRGAEQAGGWGRTSSLPASCRRCGCECRRDESWTVRVLP